MPNETRTCMPARAHETCASYHSAAWALSFSLTLHSLYLSGKQELELATLTLARLCSTQLRTISRWSGTEQNSNLHASRHTHLKTCASLRHLGIRDFRLRKIYWIVERKTRLRTRDPNLGKVMLYQLTIPTFFVKEMISNSHDINCHHPRFAANSSH